MSIFYMPRTSAYGQNVKPAAGSLLYFYDAGTTTSKTVYSDYGETVALTQPVTADSSGRFAAVYVSGNYKAVLTDPDGTVIWTEDNLVGRDGDVQDKGAFTSATNSSNYPSSGSLGDLYRVTETFTLAAVSGSHALVDGDFIICNKNGATGIDADWEIILGGGSRQKQADFSSKNLLIDVAGNSSVTASADALNLLNSNNEVYQVTDIDLTFTMPDDIPSGVEKASHWYWLWTDEDESTVLVPDLTGTATLNSSSKLVSTGMTFVTDGVTAGDIVYNTTDLTQGVVVTVDSEVSLTLDSDVFPDGDEDFLVRILSPEGLGDYTARIGAAYNNSSSNLDDSFYTQVQNPKYYIGSGGGPDFIISSNPAIISTKGATISVYQENNWCGICRWKVKPVIAYTVASGTRTGATLTITGVTFLSDTDYNQEGSGGSNASAAYGSVCYAIHNTETILYSHASTATVSYYFSGDFYCNKKPTFHT